MGQLCKLNESQYCLPGRYYNLDNVLPTSHNNKIIGVFHLEAMTMNSLGGGSGKFQFESKRSLDRIENLNPEIPDPKLKKYVRAKREGTDCS